MLFNSGCLKVMIQDLFLCLLVSFFSSSISQSSLSFFSFFSSLCLSLFISLSFLSLYLSISPYLSLSLSLILKVFLIFSTKPYHKNRKHGTRFFFIQISFQPVQLDIVFSLSKRISRSHKLGVRVN